MNLIMDTQGGLHATAERRQQLYPLCDRLRKERRLVRWSHDLRCFDLVVQSSEDKQAVKLAYGQRQRAASQG